MLTDVQGQEEGVYFLRRVAERRYTSPLILIGEEGVGRRYAVQQLAQEVFCKGSRKKGCDCFDCLQLAEKTHPDFITVFPSEKKDDEDGGGDTDKEIVIGQVREMLEESKAFPSMGSMKLILLDGADRMNTQAANALLKTLEEPPAAVRFLLTAEQPNRVLPTILSRCGRVRFHPLSEAFVRATVSSVSGDSNKALVYARMGEGSVGRALGYLNSGRTLVLRDAMVSLLAAGVQKDVPSLFSIITSVEKELRQALHFLSQLLHDLLIVRHEPSRMINVDLAESIQKLSAAMSRDSWGKLSNGTRALTLNYRRMTKSLPFHVQALFVEAFGV